MSAVRRTSVFMVGGLAVSVLAWVPAISPAHAEPVTPTFAATDFATGVSPSSVAVGDLDGDGDQDLVTADSGAFTVTVLTRGADGIYTSTATVSTVVAGAGYGPTSVAIGDLDSDGDQDLVTSNVDGSVTALTRDAGGTYTASTPSLTGAGSYSVAIGDLDGDGDQDLVTANRDVDSVSLLTRGPGGTYTRTDVGVGVTGSGPMSVKIGDLDGDGDQDLVTANADSDTVSVLTRGPGGAYTSTEYAAGDYPVSVAIGDLDGDGDQDLATANAFSDNVTVLTRGSGGAYTSTIAGSTGTATYPYSVAIGDVDGDGDQDLATANGGTDNVAVLTRGAGGAYTLTDAGSTGISPVSVALADLDSDGDQDLVTANTDSNNVTMLTNTAVHRPPNYYASTIAGATGTNPYAVAIGDLDGDGDQDLVTANYGASNVTVLTRGAGGAYTSAVAGTTGNTPVSVAIGDLDGDGDQDLVTANSSASNVTVLTRGPGGTYTSAVAGATGTRPFSVAIGDLDGDGDQDLATANLVAANVTVVTAVRDDAAPTTTDNVPTGPRNAAVPVTLTPSDIGGSGVKEIRYALGTNPGTPTTLYNPASKPTLSNGESIRYFAVDNAGNAETAHTSIAAQVDTTRPTVTLTAPAGPVTGPYTVTATFSESVTGLAADDFVVANGTAGALTGSGDTYTVTITPAADGTVTVDLPAGSATDAATNTSTAATQLVRTADLTRPSVSLSAPTGPVGGPFTVTATFSEAVTGLTASDFTVANGTAGDLAGSGDTYTVTITPGADGSLTVDLPAASAVDSAGNISTAAPQLTRTADLTRPSVTLSAPAGPVNGAFTVTATSSEAVTGMTAGDFTVANGAASDLTGSGDTYTLTITPAADGQVTVDLAAAAAADSAGNTSTAATQLTRTADLTRPSVTLSAPAGPVNGPFTVTATFSEAVTGLTAGDFTLTNGAASAVTGSGATYTVTITPAATGQVTVDLPAGSATDAAGNTNTAAQLARTADLTRPTVALSAPAGSVTGPFTVTAAFSESVTGLGATAFVVANGTAGNLTGSGTTYTVTITPTTTGQVTVDVPAGSATDAAGNTSTAAVQLTRAVVQPTFSNGSDATITGTPAVGGTLTAGTGTTVPAAESFTYAWAADGTPIAGAVASTLTLDAAQLGKSITVTVTATRAGYADAFDSSAPTALVAAGAFSTGPTAAVTGTARVGQTLIATPGAPVPSADSYGYGWYADDVAVAGETGPQLTLTSALAGRRISVEVTARRAGYTDAVSRSVVTDPVANDQAPQLSLDVTVAGSAGQATDGTSTVRRRTNVTITWSATADATVTATGELGELLAQRYPNSPLPASGQVTVKFKRTGLHPFRMKATGPGGTTSAYAAVTVVRAPTRLRVEAPKVARSGQKTSLRVTGLGGRERYTITLTRAGSRTPLVRTITGRANRVGVIHRRLLVPNSKVGKHRITIKVTGRTTRRTGGTTIRVR